MTNGDTNIPPPTPPDLSIERDLGLLPRICPKCRTPNPVSSQYCYRCGQELQDMAKICAGCRTPNLPASQFCFKCGLKLPEQASFPVETLIPAGFWRRLMSFFIDGIFISISSLVLFMVVFAIVFAISPELAEQYSVTGFTVEDILTASERPMIWLDWLVYLVGLVFPIAYWTFFVGKWGKTPAKMMLGMKVVRTDGRRVGYGRAFSRYLAFIIYVFICIFTLGLGLLVFVLTKKKQGLHDLICDTMVVKI
ncbi:MAG: RDD family protein [Dehalococcoidia bacterium]|nr:RDD family protein [Dehalococcoidia bacterium]